MEATSSLITIFLCAATLILWRRYYSVNKQINGSGKRILLLLLFLTLGISMFFGPIHPATLYISFAILFGVLLAIPLMFLINYERREGGSIYTKKSVVFFIGIIILYCPLEHYLLYEV